MLELLYMLMSCAVLLVETTVCNCTHLQALGTNLHHCHPRPWPSAVHHLPTARANLPNILWLPSSKKMAHACAHPEFVPGSTSDTQPPHQLPAKANAAIQPELEHEIQAMAQVAGHAHAGMATKGETSPQYHQLPSEAAAAAHQGQCAPSAPRLATNALPAAATTQLSSTTPSPTHAPAPAAPPAPAPAPASEYRPVSRMASSQVVAIMSTLARQGHRPSANWLDQVTDLLAGRLRALRPEQLATLVSAFVALKYHPGG